MKKRMGFMLTLLVLAFIMLPGSVLAAGNKTKSDTSKIAVALDETTYYYYDDFTEGWNIAMGEDNTQHTKVKLLADWTAKEGSFGTGVGFGDGFVNESNIKNPGFIYIPSGKTVTLDLSNHTIDRALTAKIALGQVIYNEGTLTITDSSDKKAGRITGGNSNGEFEKSNGAGICSTGTLTLEEGSITGNYASGLAGGVHVTSGTFTMTGGSITDNTAQGAGGVLVASATFTMTGGKITNNTAEMRGSGGVAVDAKATGRMCVSGTPVILENKAFEEDRNGVWKENVSNVNLIEGGNITIEESGLQDGAYIGVTKAIPDEGGYVDITESYSKNYSKYFLADRLDEGYKIVEEEVAEGEFVAKIHDDIDVLIKATVTINGIVTGYEDHMEAWDAAIHAKNATVKLFKDWEVENGKISIPSDVTINLHLNGMSITGQSETDGSVIYNEGTLTINDTPLKEKKDWEEKKKDGKITGGNTTGVGGGIYNKGGTLTINGGRVTGNCAKAGGGIYVEGGTLTMNGTSTIDVKDNTRIINRGKITGNTASNAGGGIFVNQDASLYVSGAPLVTENIGNSNIENNVYLPTGKSITIVNELTEGTEFTEGAVIGVTMENNPLDAQRITIATGADSYHLTAADAEKFTSDNPKYRMAYDSTGVVKLRDLGPDDPVLSGDNPSAVTYGYTTAPVMNVGISNENAEFTYTYAWYTGNSVKDENKIADATTASYTAPMNLSAGEYDYTVQVTVTDPAYPDKPSTTNKTFMVTIGKIVPTIIEKPVASSITYGQDLRNSSLTGGTVKEGSKEIRGAFDWTDPAEQPNAGTPTHGVTFTPEDSNYGSVTCEVSLTVAQAMLTPSLASVENKTYDGNTQGSGTIKLDGAITGDSPTATCVLNWTSKDVGTKTVNVKDITLGEEWKTNYQLSATELKDETAPADVKITPRKAAITWDYADAFVYDGTAKNVTPTVSNQVEGDNITLTTTGNSETDAGNYKATITALDNANYTLEGASGITLDWKVLVPVSFEADGGEPAPATQYIPMGDKIVDPGAITRFEYDFLGWFNGENKWDFTNDMVNQNTMTLTANWHLSTNSITSFSLDGYEGIIDEWKRTIEIYVPEGTNVINLAAVFTTSTGATAKVGDTLQESGITVNDFNAPVTYSVYSEEEPMNNPKIYTVTVTSLKAPAITGIEDGGSYVTTQQAQVIGQGLESITVNDSPVSMVTQGNLRTTAVEDIVDVKLTGNVNATYTIKAINKAGMESEMTITMQPINTLAASIAGLNTGNVKSSDQSVMEETLAMVTQVDTTNAAETEVAALEAIKEQCNILLAKISKVTVDAETAKQIAANIRPDNVKLSDKTELETAKTALEKVLTDYPDNYTTEEKQALNQRLQEVNAALTVIRNAQNVIDKINSLPDAGHLTISDEDAVKEAQDAYNKLTDYEKQLVEGVSDKLVKKLTESVTKVAEIKAREIKEAETNKLALVKTGDITKVEVPVILCIAAIVFICGVVYYRKKHEKGE